jgi:hypothetical protein
MKRLLVDPDCLRRPGASFFDAKLH